ncbi:MAG: MFS transporter [Desulfurococcaceae archaeon]
MLKTLAEGARELRSVFRGNIGVMAISWFLFSLTGSLVNPFFAKYAKDLGASDYDIAVMRSIGMLAAALSLIVGGFLTDYLGRVKVILIGTGLVAVSQFLYAVAPDWRFLFAVYVFDLVSHFYQPALTAIIMDSLRYGEEFKGFLGLYTVMAIPGLFMPIVGGVLYDRMNVSGMRLGFTLQGVVATVVLVLRVKALREVFKPRNTDLGKLVLELAGYRGVLTRALKLYVFTSILWQISLGVINTYGALYVIEVLGLSKPFWGMISSTSTLGSVVMSLVLMNRKLDYTSAVLKSALVVSVSMIFMAVPYYVGNPAVKLGVLLVVSLASSMASHVLNSSTSAIITRVLPAEVRGRATGLQRLLDNVGSSIASMVAAALYLSIGYAESFIVSSVIGVLSCAYFYVFIARTR